MEIQNLYADAQGESHWREVEVAYTTENEAGSYSETIPVKGLIFRRVQPSYDLGFHNAPRRQYIVNLDAGVQITASDGETRVIGAGQVFLVEDTTGKGHMSKAVNAQLRNCLYVTLE
jgi:hypothetical protein